jgi:hypothetical protein
MSEYDPNHETGEQQESEDGGGGSLMSLMGGTGGSGPLGMDDEDESGASGDRSVLNNSMIIGAIAVVILVFGLVVLRQFQAGNLADSGVSPQLSAKIEEYLGAAQDAQSSGTEAGQTPSPAQIRNLFKDTEAIVAMFSRDLSNRQVPVEYIKKNPFRMPIFQEAKKKEEDDKADQAEQDRKQRLASLRRQASQLQLQSVMGGAQPVAVIGGDLHQVGDEVGPFTVKAIDRLKVTLKAAGETFTIDMEKKGPGAP